MPYVEFEPMIPASERAKIVHALDRAITVTDGRCKWYDKIKTHPGETGGVGGSNESGTTGRFLW
jgi:hypothetical protein